MAFAGRTKEDEATRDLVRRRGDLMENLKSMKQRLLKFPLRKGVNYETGRYWTGKHYKWLGGVRFENWMEQLTKEEYLEEIRRIEEKVGLLDKKIEEAAESERYADVVRKFRAFRGIDYLTGLSLACEVGDFKRFPSAQVFMSYIEGLYCQNNRAGRNRVRIRKWVVLLYCFFSL